MDYRLALGIDTVDAGGRRIWVDAFHLDGVRGLQQTLEAIEGVGQGRELVLTDAENEDDGEDIDEERRYEARLRYPDFADAFRAEVAVLAGLLHPIAEA